jgi:hypothetical protein
MIKFAIQMVTAIFLCTECSMLFVLLPEQKNMVLLLMVPASVFCFGANIKSWNEELVKKKDH